MSHNGRNSLKIVGGQTKIACLVSFEKTQFGTRNILHKGAAWPKATSHI